MGASRWNSAQRLSHWRDWNRQFAALNVLSVLSRARRLKHLRPKRMLRFQLTFVGEDAERVNAAVFRAAIDPTREIVKKMAQQ
jgi:hypothetical protein